MFSQYSDDLIRRMVRIFADEFVMVLKEKGLFAHHEKCLGLHEAAEVMCITRERLLEMMKEGTAPRCCRQSFGYEFEPEEIMRWMERRLLSAALRERINVSEVREEDAANVLGIKPYYLAELRKEGKGPEHRKATGSTAVVYSYGVLQT